MPETDDLPVAAGAVAAASGAGASSEPQPASASASDRQQCEEKTRHATTVPVYPGSMPGHWELIALGIVILLLFGSRQLPSIARNLGRGVREVRETVVDVDPRRELKQLDAPPDDERAAKRDESN